MFVREGWAPGDPQEHPCGCSLVGIGDSLVRSQRHGSRLTQAILRSLVLFSVWQRSAVLPMQTVDLRGQWGQDGATCVVGTRVALGWRGRKRLIG